MNVMLFIGLIFYAAAIHGQTNTNLSKLVNALAWWILLIPGAVIIATELA